MNKEIIRLNNAGRKFHKFIEDEPRNEKHVLRGRDSRDGAFWALRNVYMNINKEEIVGIIGRNGSGKSTLLNIIAGNMPVSEGEIVTRGRVSALLTLGAGFQDELTGKENIYLNASLLGMHKEEINKIFADIVEFSELGDFINAPLGSYSSGMRMRLGFSVAIHKGFDVLVTDEIMGVGDIYFQKKCFEKMVDFKRQGKSMIIATQDTRIAERFCDRLFLLEDGQVLSSGSPKEIVEQYQVLLSKKKILSEGTRSSMVTETKRWSTDMEEWGKKEGTKEVVIKELDILNKLGRKVKKIKSGEGIRIRCDFTVNKEIDNFHFGVAIFREDGVYCYGPNTQFDGLAIEPMRKGQGRFELEFKKLSLMPGTYYISAAIWDKKETLAYDYHKGSYKLEVAGEPRLGQLLNIPARWSRFRFPEFFDPGHLPDLGYLADKWESRLNNGLIKFESLSFLNNYDYNDGVFLTDRDFKIKADFNIDASLQSGLMDLVLWIGVYRSDRIYCHGSFKKITSTGRNSEILFYPRLKLLPGGYNVSIGAWDAHKRAFLAYDHAVHKFNMISDKQDHGTVYLEHRWNWDIPKGESRCLKKSLLSA
ncbi:MAG: Wzt carbohydrate-binding domain-containing protein [Candidatus Omnitrophota bacterium]|jgi:ABC-type polysaccharide/polyol phosphate transport system ATPase subunit